ncbi:MAG TPA: sigma-70 family RNA polymerase sigma factor [Solirubrobacteraceae bacterium]|nr:sigma-70 family RNA polymerase sigma factor [Solirubrobacteraceae bacterium]
MPDAAGRDRIINARYTDSELLEQMDGGSSAAFSEFYDRYALRAYRVARSICRNRESTEEALQDAFLSIWANCASYRAERAPVTAWALTIVRYRAIEIARRDHRPQLATQPRERASHRDQVIDDAVASDDAQRLRDLLGEIPPKQREVITLAFYGQLSHSEIAQHLDLPAGTVKGRMRLGLEKLRDGLQGTAA